MRVGIDGRLFAQPLAGVRRYVDRLCPALDEILCDALFYVYTPHPVSFVGPSDRWTVRVDSEAPGMLRRNTFVWLKTRAATLARRDDLDVYWAPGTFVPRAIPDVPVVSTVYDLTHLVAPGTMKARGLWQYRAFFARDLRRADVVLAISQGTADRLATHLGVDARVVRPVVSPDFQPAEPEQIRSVLGAHGVQAPYLLSVATWEPRKNLGRLVQAFSALASDGTLSTHSLVLAGSRGWKYRDVNSALALADQRVRVLDFVPDADLRALYSGADAVVYPSIYEGFGLPVAEARACGARVVTADLPELREAGGTDAVYVEPTVDGIKNGIMAALSQPARLPSRQPPASDAATGGVALAAALKDAASYVPARS